MASNSKERYVSELQQLFKTQAAQLYSGQRSLCLTTSCLNFLQTKLSATPDDSKGSKDLQRLKDNFSKLCSLKLIPDKKRTVAPSLVTLDVSPFRALQTLVLKRVPVVSLTGLSNLREQLIKLVIERSLVPNLELVLVQCGGDESSARVWSNLKELDLSVNAIETLGHSLRCLPVVEKMNFSNNQIGMNQASLATPTAITTSTSSSMSGSTSSSSSAAPSPTTLSTGATNTSQLECVSGVQYLTKIRWLHLGFNQLTVIPPFSEKAQYSLTTLILRNNSLMKIEGIEVLDTLRELDLSENLLSRHTALKPMRNLHHLAVLYLAGNPLVYDLNHRVKTVENFSNLVNPSLFVFDGKKLTSKEKKALSRTITQFISSSSSSIQSRSLSPLPPISPLTSRFNRIEAPAGAKTTTTVTASPSTQSFGVISPSCAKLSTTTSKSFDASSPRLSSKCGTGHRRAKKERVVDFDEDSPAESENIVKSSSGLNKSDSHVPLLHEKRMQVDQDLRKQLKEDWLVTGGAGTLTDDGERATSSLHAMSSSVPNPPSVLEKSMSPRTQHRHHKHRKRSPRGNTSPNLSSSPTTQTASTTSSSSSMLSESSSLSVDKQMEPDSRTVTETHSQTTGKHSGTRKARSSPVEMNSHKSHSHNAAVAGTPSQKGKEKGGPGRGWVNIELPDSDSVQNAADDAVAVGEQYIVNVYESDTEEEEEGAKRDSVILSFTERFLQEIDINGRVNDKLDLHCLKAVNVVDRTVRGNSCRVLVLQFSHERRDRRKREYVLSQDSCDDEAAILEQLNPIVSKNASVVSIATKLECLKCQRAIDWSEALDPPSSQPQPLYPSSMERSKSLLNKLCPYCHHSFLIQMSSEVAASPTASFPFAIPPSSKNDPPKTVTKTNVPVVTGFTEEPALKERMSSREDDLSSETQLHSRSSSIGHVDLSYSYPTSPEPSAEKAPPTTTPTSSRNSNSDQSTHVDMSPFVAESQWRGAGEIVSEEEKKEEEEMAIETAAAWQQWLSDTVDGEPSALPRNPAADIDGGYEHEPARQITSQSLNPFDEDHQDDSTVSHSHKSAISGEVMESSVEDEHVMHSHWLPNSPSPPMYSVLQERSSPLLLSQQQPSTDDVVPILIADASSSVSANGRSASYKRHTDRERARQQPAVHEHVKKETLGLYTAASQDKLLGTQAKKDQQQKTLNARSMGHSRSHSVDLKRQVAVPALDCQRSSSSKINRGSQASIDSFSSDTGARGVGEGWHEETSSGPEKHGSSGTEKLGSSGVEKHSSSGSGGEKKSSSSSSRFRRFVSLPGRRNKKTKKSSEDSNKRPASPVIPYREDDPAYIHSTFNVHLDMEVFDTDKQEHFQLAMKCPVVEYGEWTEPEIECFLIVSNMNAFIYKVTAPESLQPTNWLELKAMLPLRSLVYITIGIGYQWLQLEFGGVSLADARCFTFLIRNEDKCRKFYDKLSYVVSDVPRSSLKNIGVAQFSLMNIKNPEKFLRLAILEHYDQLHPYKSSTSKSSIPGEEEEEDDSGHPEQLKKYLLAYQYQQGQEPSQVPVTLVLTNRHLYLAIQNHQWPLPKLHPPPNRSDLLPPFSGVVEKEISDVEQIILYDDQNCNFTLQFFQESLHYEEKDSWTIILKNPKSVKDLVTKLKDLWEQQFATEFNFTYK